MRCDVSHMVSLDKYNKIKSIFIISEILVNNLKLSGILNVWNLKIVKHAYLIK